jgi:hypothetical protein
LTARGEVGCSERSISSPSLDIETGNILAPLPCTEHRNLTIHVHTLITLLCHCLHRSGFLITICSDVLINTLVCQKHNILDLRSQIFDNFRAGTRTSKSTVAVMTSTSFSENWLRVSGESAIAKLGMFWEEDKTFRRGNSWSLILTSLGRELSR